MIASMDRSVRSRRFDSIDSSREALPLIMAVRRHADAAPASRQAATSRCPIAGRQRRSTVSLRAARLQAEHHAESSSGAPVAHACGLHAVGYSTGNWVRSRA